jgi:hypothetical protein
VEAFVVSVIDDLRSAQQQALTRLNELKPLVEEYEELRREVKRLGLTEAALTNGGGATKPAKKPAASPAKRPAARRTARRSTTSANGAEVTEVRRETSKPTTTAAPSAGRSKPQRSPGRPHSSTRVDDIARLVAQQPGVTVAEIGRSLDVDATSLYRPLRRLISEGRLRKDGPALHPPAQ